MTPPPKEHSEMSGPYSGNEDAAEDTAARLAASNLPPAVAGALRGLSIPGETAALPPGWRMETDGAGGGLLLEEIDGAAPRLWAVADADGWLHALLDWRAGGLNFAWLRLPGGDGLEIQPGAVRNLLWGESDQLRHLTGPLDNPRSKIVGLLPALPYDRLENLPPFDFPAALPPGAGGAVLNLLARLMCLQGRQKARYRGPYPTGALFDSLARCFRPSLEGAEPQAPADEDPPRARFSRDEMELAFRGEMALNPVDWEPAPFAQILAAPHVLVHLRDGVETVWIDTTAFRFRPWRNGLLAAGSAVWLEPEAEEGAYGVGLAMLGAPWRRFLSLGRDGRILAPSSPQPSPEQLRAERMDSPIPLSDPWRAIIFCWSALGASPALAPAILALEPTLPLHWTSLDLCLAKASAEGGLLLNAALAGRFLALKFEREETAGTEDATGEAEASGGSEESGTLAMMMISDVLGELAPLVRRAAQQNLALEPPIDPGHLVQEGASIQAEARTRMEGALFELVDALQQSEHLPSVPGWVQLKL